ncbi:GntR family transcriptional regulator [Acidiphilium sp. C61]|jgi:DNA-binding GntR family transcriptional regulator|uniref:GntR family transcriptional regulator n=1 Tax=Acidiphilium sp. C61 TaxID=1671485 RepID=UPI00157B7F3C|nr:GntR family transcriptional regulator [Acidiphilium sp. C61]
MTRPEPSPSAPPPPDRPAKRHRPSAADAYESLLKAIEGGALPPGARLRETELAQRFGISRTPVREALKRLEHQGLVVHTPHQGAMVATLSDVQMTELYEMRVVLEGAAARMAAQHAAESDIALLAALVERDAALIASPEDLALNNRLFHRQILTASRNRYLHDMLESLRLSLALLGGTTLAVAGRAATAVEEHRAILERIAARDTDGAEAAARGHIRAAFQARILRAAMRDADADR